MSVINPNATTNSQKDPTRTFVTALVVNGALLGIEVAAFIVLKSTLWRIYSPRAWLPPPDKRTTALPGGIWKWLPALLFIPPKEIIHKNGLDAYMFLRFIRMLIWIFLTFTIVTFAIIVPSVAINVNNGNSGLDRISWVNLIGAKAQPRFGAHVAVAYVLTFFVLYMIRREMFHFIEARHQFLVSKSHLKLPQARTVLITSVPHELAKEENLMAFGNFVPGGIDRVWIPFDHTELNKHYERREELCKELEKACAAILWEANKAWRMRLKDHKKQQKRLSDEERAADGPLVPSPASREFLNELLPPEKHPRMRTGLLGLFGAKVDTFEYCKEEIAKLNRDITKERNNLTQGKFLGSVFIRCNLQIGAHVLAQCLSYHEPLKMYNKWLEANPKDIVWENLDDGALEMRARYVISWAATIGLIIAWSFPSVFIGTLSSADNLCEKVHWLKWVCTAPDPVPGLITGVLPPLLLAIVFALLPLVLRALAWYQCLPRYSLIAVSVYKRFFFFLLIHGFLIVTLSSGITKAIEDIINKPTQTVQQLAAQLPGASVFFLTYMVTQGLAGAASALLQLVPLLLYFVRKWLAGRTPRQAYEVTFIMPSGDFETMLPRLSLLAAITFAYSVLSPLINFLAFISFILFYLAYKFLFTQVFDQPDHTETGGLFFPMAISNLFVGLYIEQIALACLFFLKISTEKVAAIVEAVLMLVLFVITIGFHILHNKSFKPMIEYLPASLGIEELKGIKQKSLFGKMDILGGSQLKGVKKRFKATTKVLDKQLEKLKAEVTVDPEKVKNRLTMADADPVRNYIPMAILKEKADPPEEDNRYSYESQAVATGVTTSPSAMDTRPSVDAEHLDGYPPTQLSRYASNSTRHSRDSDLDALDETVESAPTMDPAAPGGGPTADLEREEQEDDNAFSHPSTYKEQPWIWIPEDPLEFSKILTRELRDAGVDASDLGAEMNEKGIVKVTRGPPDEEWLGGHDR